MTMDTGITGQKLNPAVVQTGQGERPARQAQEGELTRRPVEKTEQAEPVDLKQQALVVQAAAQRLDEIVKLISSDLNIAVHQDVGQTVVKVIDRDNDEVIRQIPSEEVLALMERLTKIAEQYRGDISGVLIQGEA